jgi:hypothetical protein
MNLNDVYDRAYENAMRQGYAIDGDVLRGCINAAAHANPPFKPEQLEEILLYIKENPEMLPTDPAEAPRWGERWAGFFAAQKNWKETTQGAHGEAPPPPLRFHFGL